MVRGRFAALIVRVLPEERVEMGQDLAEALEWFRGRAVASVPMDKLPLEEEELEVLLLWLCGSRKTRRLREGTMRLYLLALEILPEVMRTRQNKVMTLDDLGAAFEEAAAAFTEVAEGLRCSACGGRGYLKDEQADALFGLCGECKGCGLENYKENKEAVNMPARARWSWRAKKLLAGLPRMKWQR
jgi:ribosomal protein L33